MTERKEYLTVRYLPINQAYAVMWMDQVLRIVPTRKEARALVKEWTV